MTAARKPTRRRKTVRHKRHPNDWYVEPSWAVDAIIPVVAPHLKGWFRFNDMIIWDPCCGLGTIPDAFGRAGYEAVGSDIVDRCIHRGHWAAEADFFTSNENVARFPLVSIFSNPPYLHTEAFVRKALNVATDLVGVLVPLNWLCAAKRFEFFTEHPPMIIAFLSTRPSMPPGDQIAAMGDKAFKGGKIDYCWVIWNRRQKSSRTTVTWICKPEDAE